MRDQVHRAIAIVGVGAVLPDAQNAKEFWNNISTGRYSISETPVDRWDPALYYDPDPKAPDKTYSKIGGWVREFNWEPLKWRLPIPPKVAESMDRTQKWSIMSAREALLDYGYPERPLDGDRTAVILGNAMAGDQHYKTALRIFFPELTRELESAPSFRALPEAAKTAIVEETPTDLASTSRGVSPAVGGVVRRCLEKAREDRYASGRDVAVALEAVLAAPSSTAALREVEERSPYPGLSAFTEKDKAVFYGRES